MILAYLLVYLPYGVVASLETAPVVSQTTVSGLQDAGNSTTVDNVTVSTRRTTTETDGVSSSSQSSDDSDCE